MKRYMNRTTFLVLAVLVPVVFLILVALTVNEVVSVPQQLLGMLFFLSLGMAATGRVAFGWGPPNHYSFCLTQYLLEEMELDRRYLEEMELDRRYLEEMELDRRDAGNS